MFINFRTSIQLIFNNYAPTPVFPEEIYSISLYENITTYAELMAFNFIMPEDAEFDIISGNDDDVNKKSPQKFIS